MNRSLLTVQGLKSKARRLAARITKTDSGFFLDKITGVLHVGANLGQEKDAYAARQLNVIWFEPIPEIFARLEQSLSGYPKQKAYCQLVTDADDREYTFNISNNDGASSSIFDMAAHKELWPTVTYTKSAALKSVSLSTFVRRERVNLAQHDALVMDTQGSELLVLKGAVDVLPAFKFIKTEVADFESYKGCCQLSGIDEFLTARGFRLVAKGRFAHKRGVGSYYDVVYAAGSAVQDARRGRIVT